MCRFGGRSEGYFSSPKIGKEKKNVTQYCKKWHFFPQILFTIFERNRKCELRFCARTTFIWHVRI